MERSIGNPITVDWVKVASFLDEAAEFYSELDDTMNASMCIDSANRARMKALRKAMSSCFDSVNVE